MLLTHSHGDHSDGVERLGIEPTTIAEGDALSRHHGDSPRRATRTTTSASCSRDACFAGDLILGEGSTIVPPRAQGGSMADYLRLAAKSSPALDLEVIYPGHGPVIDDPAAKIAEYIEHRESPRAAADRGARCAASARGMRLLERGLGRRARGACCPMAAFAMQAHWRSSPTRAACPGDLAE